ncbi:MAG: class III extradiol ring-cleavage dioxygenase [Oleibacter sp.]|nr:class III extradiol ring-cleavage dioxygenase [Thalassolituus sp.]
MKTQPAIFIPHGGGPCFFMDWNPADTWDDMAAMLRSIPSRLPQKPDAILIVSAHWEESVITFASGVSPRLEYDYYGFPEHTYQLQYDAQGTPELADRAAQLLRNAGIDARTDDNAPWDHGVFIPLKVAFPDADIPILAMSMKKGLDPAEHVAIGQALAPLREQNVLMIGSGLSYHNLKTFFSPSQTESLAAGEFDDWLCAAVTQTEIPRTQQLQQWQTAPYARQVHPREEHLMPLMVMAGAGGDIRGDVFYRDAIFGKAVMAVSF